MKGDQGDYPDFQGGIAALAYRFWVDEGCPQDRSVQHWEQAERDLRERLGESATGGQAPGGIPNETGASGKMG